MSIDRRLPVSDYHGQSPCIEPVILGHILDRLEPLKSRIREERATAQDAWAGIDKLAEAMEASR